MLKTGIRCALLLVGAASVFAAGSETAPAPPDPWVGKRKADAIALLGEPDKSKQHRGGGETLVYKLIRVGADFDPRTPARLVELPGVGLVGRVDKSRSPGALGLEPSSLDDEGRLIPGGVAESRSASASYDPKTGKTERSGLGDPPLAPPGGGKFKLTLELDAQGMVTDWSVSSK